MKRETCSTSDAELFVAKLTAKSIAPLYDLTFGTSDVRDWGKEVEELRKLARKLWGVGLSPLVKNLASVCRAGNGDQFRDYLFEAVVAKRMLSQGAALEYEPSGYGKRPPDFLARLGHETALVECVNPGGDWDEKLGSIIHSALRGDPKCRFGVQVVLAWACPSVDRKGLDEVKAYARHAAARVVRRARRLAAGSEWQMELFCGLVVAEISRGAGDECSSVRWDWNQGWEARLPPRAVRREQLQRVVAVRDKTVKKFRGLSQHDVKRALRVLVVDGAGRMVNPKARRVTARLQCRKAGQVQTLGAEFRKCLDAMVFTTSEDSEEMRLVEEVVLKEAVVFARDADRKRRVHRFISALGWRTECLFDA